MQHLNFEVKARTSRQADIRVWLLANGAEPRGTDFQTDTYFKMPMGAGRLKLRQGNIENNLIHYQRSDDAEARVSDVALAPVADAAALKNILTRALGVWVEVKKRREIYFIENVKFHLDELEGLGQFVEIEAIATNPDIPLERLQAQCAHFMAMLSILPDDIVAASYSDLLLPASERGK
ncbi:MAG: class IV adenylate cyclase [Saprospiraceae bacterium]|nr:class IV adenylate cyclase [Saprospiraceae bacterium]